MQPVLEHLAQERLLRPIADTRGGAQTYEIFHDVLADSVLAWSARSHRAARARTARLEARRRHRRLAGVSAVSVMGLLVAIALMVWALAERTNARDRATEAKASELQALAVNALPTDSGLALALAAEAVRLSPTPAAESALRRALLHGSPPSNHPSRSAGNRRRPLRGRSRASHRHVSRRSKALRARKPRRGAASGGAARRQCYDRRAGRRRAVERGRDGNGALHANEPGLGFETVCGQAPGACRRRGR